MKTKLKALAIVGCWFLNTCNLRSQGTLEAVFVPSVLPLLGYVNNGTLG